MSEPSLPTPQEAAEALWRELFPGSAISPNPPQAVVQAFHERDRAILKFLDDDDDAYASWGES